MAKKGYTPEQIINKLREAESPPLIHHLFLMSLNVEKGHESIIRNLLYLSALSGLDIIQRKLSRTIKIGIDIIAKTGRRMNTL